MSDGVGHQHTARCWKEYTACGEHHAHDYNCGNGMLGPGCPTYVRAKLDRFADRAAQAGIYSVRLSEDLRVLREEIKKRQFAVAYGADGLQKDIARVRALTSTVHDTDAAFERIVQYLLERA